MPSQPFQAIARAIARTRNRRLLAALILLPFAGFLIAVPILNPGPGETSRGATFAVAGLGVVCLVFALVFASIAVRLRNPRNNPIMQLLVDQPQDVAWVYTTSHTKNGLEVARTVVLYTAAGTHHTVVVTKDDEASVFADLERVAPHAAVGYSKEIAADYKANPARWRPSALQ
jgi:hypothetical protein